MIVASLVAWAIAVLGIIGILVLANRTWAEQDARWWESEE